MAKIAKSTIYSIQWLSHIGKSTKEIAEELNVTEKQVDNVLKKNQSEASGNALPVKSSPVQSKSKDLMIRHTRDKKNNQVAIMTKEASEVNDLMKQKLRSKESKGKLDCIFNPNNE